MNLEYDSLNEQLLQQLPVLGEPRYTQLIGGIEAGPYVVSGVMFNQYLVDLAKGDDIQGRSEVATFIENMAIARDERVSDMLASEVLPTLVGTQVVLNADCPLLAVATRRRLRYLRSRLTANVELPSSEERSFRPEQKRAATHWVPRFTGLRCTCLNFSTGRWPQ